MVILDTEVHKFLLRHLQIQRYDDFAVASYTLLAIPSMPEGEEVVAHNESRVMGKIDGE